eukprot:CAMPEP_0180831820 /NCGR_PEP_ID=MMETSP1038_2-20121128/76526_1 /TAXON_ID=632150 /ORGANISM="Azadinium spinosum, Strain 3D9" /LENGTH=125 /DNA_ID=CAMNT_0022875011 /DNA_START=24 /DNA_END=398 /DNA_ORIENTATION=+
MIEGGQMKSEPRETWLGDAWGASWVPFFFTLSGFVITYSQLNRQDPEEMDAVVPFLQRRFAAIYPLYALSLAWGLMLAMTRAESVGASMWTTLPVNMLLLQAWSWDMDCPKEGAVWVCVQGWNFP